MARKFLKDFVDIFWWCVVISKLWNYLTPTAYTQQSHHSHPPPKNSKWRMFWETLTSIGFLRTYFKNFWTLSSKFKEHANQEFKGSKITRINFTFCLLNLSKIIWNRFMFWFTSHIKSSRIKGHADQEFTDRRSRGSRFQH